VEEDDDDEEEEEDKEDIGGGFQERTEEELGEFKRRWNVWPLKVFCWRGSLRLMLTAPRLLVA
jgi:hypothetical protein